jgi:hypothetical protein
MGTAADEYFTSGVNITNGQVIKTEEVVQYFNGNANQPSIYFDNTGNAFLNERVFFK